jgi:hypothetical protein
MTWPRCSASVTICGETTECVLPKNHEMDGEEMHVTESGLHWSMSFHYEDGRAVRL